MLNVATWARHCMTDTIQSLIVHLALRILMFRVRSIRKSRLRSSDLLSNSKSENRFPRGFHFWKSMSGRISVEVFYLFLCSIGNAKIQILRSKSRFPNRTHPHAVGDESSFIAIYLAISFLFFFRLVDKLGRKLHSQWSLTKHHLVLLILKKFTGYRMSKFTGYRIILRH